MKLNLKTLFIVFICLCNVFSYLYSIILGEYNGDYSGHKVNITDEQLTINLLFVISIYLLVYFIYTKIENKFYRSGKKINSISSLFYYFLILIITFNYYLTLQYSIGFIGKSHPWAFLVNRIPVIDAGFILFALERNNKEKNKLFWPIIVFIILLGVLRGMVGHLFIFILLEVFIREKQMITLRKLLKLVAVFIILILLYPKLLDLKWEIRGQERPQTSIVDGIFHLTGRLSVYPNYCLIYENKNKVLTFIEDDLGHWYFLPEFASPILSERYLGYRFTNTTINSFIASGFQVKDDHVTSNLTGLVSALLLTFNVSIISGILLILLLILVLLSLVSISRLYLNYNINNYIFLVIFNYVLSGVVVELAFSFYGLLFWTFIVIALNSFSRTIILKPEKITSSSPSF